MGPCGPLNVRPDPDVRPEPGLARRQHPKAKQEGRAQVPHQGNEWSLMKQLVVVLSRLEALTRALDGSKGITISPLQLPGPARP